MSITVVCPACGSKMSAPSHLIGRMAKCPRCAKAIKVVPSDDAPSPAVVCQPASAPPGGRDELREPAAQGEATATKGPAHLSRRRIGLPIAGAIATLAAVAIGVIWLGRPGPFFSTAGKQNGVNHIAETARDPVKNAALVKKESSWADASAGPIQHGDVRVQLTSVAVRNVRLKDVLGEDSVSPTKNLTIGVLIQNTSPTRKIDFLGWSGVAATGLTLAEMLATGEGSKENRADTPPAPAASLRDNFGKLYKRVSLDFGAQIPGQIRTATPVDPGGSLEDLLVFEPLIDNVEFLQLELPAAAFGDTGVLRLQIPKELIHH